MKSLGLKETWSKRKHSFYQLDSLSQFTSCDLTWEVFTSSLGVTLHLHLSIYFVQRNSNNTAKCQKNRTTRLWHALTVAHCNQDSNNAKHTKRQINKKNGHQYLRKSVKSTCFTVLLNFEKELKSTVWGRDTETFTSSLDVNLHKVFQFTRWIDVKYSPGVTWREIFTSSPGELMLNIHKFTRCDLWNIHQFTSWIDVKY